MREPEWPSVCECKYDEVRDRMDLDDCLLHSGMEDDLSLPDYAQDTGHNRKTRREKCRIAIATDYEAEICNARAGR
jgi:hypothetical protein